ncbi:hypothetical protein IJG92_01190 [Candidatus Saccharibacteria bacterium]|nr:hypothetical protein [Candidatus Saccharibacteria bacterium]
MKNKRKSILAIVFLGLSLGLSLVLTTGASAINNSAIVSKAVFEGVYGCFNGGAYRKSFYASNPPLFILNDGATDAVKLPYGMTNVGDNNLNCKEVMLGYNNDSGIKGGLIPTNVRTAGALIPTNVRTAGADITTVKNYFAGQTVGSNGLPVAGGATVTTNTTTSGGIGYTAEAITEGTGGVSKTLSYSIGEHNCTSGESNPSFNGKTSITFPTVVSTDSGLKIMSNNDISSNGASFTINNCGNLKFTVGIPVADSSSVTFDVTLNDVGYQTITYTRNGNDISITERGLTIGDDTGNYVNLDPKTTQASAGSSIVSDYKLSWGGGNWTALLKGLNSNNRAGISVNQVYAGYNYLALTRQELFDLYVHYIENSNIMNAKLVAEGQNDFSGVDVNLCTDKKYKVNKTNATGRTVYGVDSNLHFNAGPLSLDDIISTLNANGPYDDIDNGGRCAVSKKDPSNPSTGTTSSTPDGMCDDLVDEYAGGGIGAMQWILCPTMDNTSYTADWVDNITQDMLEVKADTYKGLDTTWGEVRNIANITIIIFLLVVIFSQLTGRGIDNYGIKKMLPRIIMMAIVVNLSLYICQIAVDLSNIFGSGLRDMFGGMGGSPSGGASYVTGAITGIFAAAAGGGGAAAGAASTALAVGAAGWVAVVIAIIVLVLVIIVAVVVLWFMVAARQVIIIFCILISPLAFAAFILPNTQGLFKKWWDLFKAALIIFPICGAVSGISAMIRNLVNNGSLELGVAGNLILMVLPFLVFFLLPTLLKQAISALGKVGGALTTLGTSVRSGARNIGQAAISGAKNTEAFKNRQVEAARNRQSESSQRTIERLEALKKQREAEGGALSDTETRRLARAHETQRKLGLEDQAARTILTEKDYAGKSLDDLMSDWNTAFDSGDTARMDALTNVIVSRHGPGGVSQIASSLANREGDNGIFAANGEFRNGNMEKSFTALQANMMQNSALATAMQNKASDVFQMVSGGGYVNGTRQNVSAHAANNGIATQMKDWATQSNGTIQRAATNGGFDAKMARDLLNSTDPAIQSGIQSDKDKRATLEAIAGGYKGDWSNKADVDRAKINYAHEQALTENAEFDRRTLERQQVASQTENLRRAAEGLENLNRNQGGDNNSGQGFDQGAGI